MSVLLLWARFLLSPSEAEQPELAPQSLRTTLGHALLVVSATAAIALFASVLYYHTLCPNRASAGQAKLQRECRFSTKVHCLRGQPNSCLSARVSTVLDLSAIRICAACARKRVVSNSSYSGNRAWQDRSKDAQCVMDHASLRPRIATENASAPAVTSGLARHNKTRSGIEAEREGIAAGRAILRGITGRRDRGECRTLRGRYRRLPRG